MVVPTIFRNNNMANPSPSASPSRQLTVVDVYDLAAEIGKDFEGLIENYGNDSVRNLMPKVISALETLEALAGNNDRDNEQIITLNKVVEKLELEKQNAREDRQRFEKELEEIEENYKKEISELWAMVEKLQEDAREPPSPGHPAAAAAADPMTTSVYTISGEEFAMMKSLKHNVEQLRDQVKAIQSDCADKAKDIDNLQAQVERGDRQNRELQRKNKMIQNQGRVLIEEKNELMSKLDSKEEEVIELVHKLGETERAKLDLEQIQEKGEDNDKKETPKKNEEQSVLDRENMPRFTLNELRTVLHEKNTLKARVMELEEELDNLRPAPTPSPRPPDEKESELPVYGPMPREPDEKLYPWKFERKESGVRKFFKLSSWSRSSLRLSRPAVGHHQQQQQPRDPQSPSFELAAAASPSSSPNGLPSKPFAIDAGHDSPTRSSSVSCHPASSSSRPPHPSPRATPNSSRVQQQPCTSASSPFACTSSSSPTNNNNNSFEISSFELSYSSSEATPVDSAQPLHVTSTSYEDDLVVIDTCSGNNNNIGGSTSLRDELLGSQQQQQQSSPLVAGSSQSMGNWLTDALKRRLSSSSTSEHNT